MSKYEEWVYGCCGECKHITKTIERVHDAEYWYDDVILRCGNKDSEYYKHHVEHMDKCDMWEQRGVE